MKSNKMFLIFGVLISFFWPTFSFSEEVEDVKFGLLEEFPLILNKVMHPLTSCGDRIRINEVEQLTGIEDHEDLVITIEEIYAERMYDEHGVGKSDFVIDVELETVAETDGGRLMHDHMTGDEDKVIGSSSIIKVEGGMSVKPGEEIRISGRYLNNLVSIRHPNTRNVRITLKLREDTPHVNVLSTYDKRLDEQSLTLSSYSNLREEDGVEIKLLDNGSRVSDLDFFFLIPFFYEAGHDETGATALITVRIEERPGFSKENTPERCPSVESANKKGDVSGDEEFESDQGTDSVNRETESVQAR